MTDDRRPALLPMAATLLVVLLLIVFASDYLVLRIIAGRLFLPLILAAATILAAFGTGRMLTRLVASRAFAATPPPRVDPASDFLVGFPLFGLLSFLVAIVSAGAVAQSVVLIAGIAIGAVALRDVERGRPDVEGRSSAAVAIGWFGAAVLLLIGVLHAMAPAFTLDEVAYHLAIPRQWAIAGSAIELPLLSHSYFPLGIESADLPAMSILGADGAIAAHFVHLFAAGATALVLFRWIALTATGAAAWLAIISTPALLLTAGWAWNEWPLVGVVLVAVRAAQQLTTDDDAGGAARLSVALAAGMLVKYTFALAAVAIVVAALVAVRRARVRTAFLIRAVLLAAIPGSAFLLRNLILTGNPLAPFFQRGSPDLAGFRWEGELLATIRAYLFHGRFLDEALGVGLPALAAAALLILAAGTTFVRLITAGFLLSGALLFTQAPSSRIVLPFLIVPAVFAAIGLTVAPRRMWRSSVALLLLIGSAAQFHLSAFHTLQAGVAPVAAGLMSDDDFLRSHRRSFAAVQALDGALPAGSKTLVLGTNEIFWFSRGVLGGGNSDGPRISRWLARGHLASKLAAEGVTHVGIIPAGLAVPPDPADRRAAERSTVLQPQAADALQRFLALHGREVNRGPDFILYEIVF